ncbi:lysylphosphatidylglycerol synthase transmembrane domain-containing protein [Corynebacterium lubricantis]|uniref:lysylphosphatidylglycerol synthase transmembrane domain-containing protein n=1 Tax=Corynebacterium lubricantis TaxID=541095 RepID=UPI00036E2B18|nr:YbhN family protein [Corynebacterium lubricantis]
MNPTLKKWINWLAPLVVLIVLLVAFRDELPFLGEAFFTLLEAHPVPLVFAVISAVLALVAMSEVMRLLINSDDDLQVSLKETTDITLASNAWSTSLPGGAAFSGWLTFRVQRSWGASVALCGWFFVVSSVISTMWLVLIGIGAVLFLGADLSLTSLIVTLVLTVLVIWAVYWATTHPAILKRWAARLPQKIRGKSMQIIDQLATVHMTPQAFFGASVASLLNRLLDALTLFFTVWAVLGSPPGISASHNHTTIMGIALAYVMAKLAGIAQVTPGGVGTVEALTAGALVASGMTLVDATAATVIYRIISFGLITIIGWIIFLVKYSGKGYMLGRGRAAHTEEEEEG